MSEVLIGFGGSILAAIFFGLYPVPRRYVKFGINDFMISMTIGIIFAGLVTNYFVGLIFPPLTVFQWGMGLLAGFFCVQVQFYMFILWIV